MILVKELKFRPNTDDHDYEFKKNHAIGFLGEGTASTRWFSFAGARSLTRISARSCCCGFAEDLAMHGAVEGQPRLEGRNAHVLISPIKSAKDKEREKGKVQHPPGPGKP